LDTDKHRSLDFGVSSRLLPVIPTR